MNSSELLTQKASIIAQKLTPAIANILKLKEKSINMETPIETFQMIIDATFNDIIKSVIRETEVRPSDEAFK